MFRKRRMTHEVIQTLNLYNRDACMGIIGAMGDEHPIFNDEDNMNVLFLFLWAVTLIEVDKLWSAHDADTLLDALLEILAPQIGLDSESCAQVLQTIYKRLEANKKSRNTRVLVGLFNGEESMLNEIEQAHFIDRVESYIATLELNSASYLKKTILES